MTLASKHTSLVVVLLLLGAIAPLAASLMPRRAADCAEPQAIYDAFVPQAAIHKEQEHHFDSIDQWVIAVARDGTRNPRIDFRLMRSFDAKQLYLDPTGYADRGSDFKQAAESVVLETESGALPVWLLSIRTDAATRTVGYFFALGPDAVESPFLEYVATFWRGWFEGVVPMRLYIVSVDADRGREDLTEERAKAWLERAFRLHRRVCGS